MKWKWIAVLFIFKSIHTLDLPNDSWKQSQPSNLPMNSNKSLNKARHKSSRFTNPTTKSSSNSEIKHDVLESYFPDVIYPTTILESVQPFYYLHAVKDDVLSPFSNDVKSSYKTLTSGKEKQDYLTNGSFVPKTTEKNNMNVTLDDEHEQHEKVADIADPFVLYNETIYDVEEIETASYQNSTFSNDNLETLKNKAAEIEKEEEKFLYSSQEIHTEIVDYVDILDGNIVLNTFQPIDVDYSTFSKTSVKVVDLDNETSVAVEKDLVEENDVRNHTTLYIAPNYVMTSNTGNSHADFVNDIMNIYALIEESIRAISVVDFIVSKTLGALGLENKKNETIASENIDFGSNRTNCPYEDNISTLYEYYDCSVADYIPVCNSTEFDNGLLEENVIESIIQTSNMQTDEHNTEEIHETCFYSNNNIQDCIFDGASV